MKPLLAFLLLPSLYAFDRVESINSDIKRLRESVSVLERENRNLLQKITILEQKLKSRRVTPKERVIYKERVKVEEKIVYIEKAPPKRQKQKARSIELTKESKNTTCKKGTNPFPQLLMKEI